MRIIHKILLAFVLSAPSLAGWAGGVPAPSKAMADSAYAQERYSEAAAIYQQLLDRYGESAQLYYNLGNCYYRQDSIARAVLCYERSLLLNPSDKDARFNLEMARSKTVDRVSAGSELFFVTFYRSLVLSLSMQQWAWLAVLSFVLMLTCIGVYLFAPRLLAKQVGFYAAVFLLLLSAFSNVAAYNQRQHILRRTGAVVMVSSVVVKSTPSTSGTDLFILHEGTHVEIVDDTMHEWAEVRLADGKQGWLQRTEIEVI